MLSIKDRLKVSKIILLVFCSALFEIATTISIVLLTQVITNPQTSQKYYNYIYLYNLSTHQSILYAALIVGALYLSKNIFACFEVFIQNFTIQKMSYRFQRRLLKRYLQLDYGRYLSHNPSDILSIVSTDTEAVFSSGLTSLSIIFSESLISLCLITVLFIANPSTAFIILSFGGLFGLILSKKLLPLFYNWGKALQDARLFGHKHILQLFYGFKEIILLGKQKSFINQCQIHLEKKSKLQALQHSSNNLPRIITETLFVLILVITITYFCYTHMEQQMMMGILAGYMYTGFRVMPGLNRIIMQLNIFKSISPSISKVVQALDFKNRSNIKYLDIKDFKFNENIVIRDLSFKYQSSNHYALQNISLDIFKGECLGIIGKTGSGKSTLCDILLGLINPESGYALADNQYPLTSNQWHKQIGYVHQTIYLIDDTIQANILFGESNQDIDYTRLKNAISAAQLDQLIKKLPDGLHTLVGDRGIRLSGGERQRIVIARALYRNPNVLIFDEATSSLDNETELALMETIENIRSNERTIIMIAHRLTTLRKCNRILIMKDGKIDRIVSYNDISEEIYDSQALSTTTPDS
ncbi:MAG: ABC transporter ATP-binding protein [Gammaproteobacteria bacterium]